jgi:hypothetical protein
MGCSAVPFFRLWGAGRSWFCGWEISEARAKGEVTSEISLSGF